MPQFKFLETGLLRTRPASQAAITVCGAVLVLLLLFGVSPVTAVLVTIQILVLCLAGSRLLEILVPGLIASSHLSIGPSFIVGVAAWVIPTQVLGGSWIASLLILSLMSAFALFGKGRAIEAASDDTPKDILVLTSTALFIMSSEWSLLTAPAAVLLVGIFVRSAGASWSTRIQIPALTLAGIVILRIALSSYGPNWWIVNEEFSYYEALRVHLASHGIWRDWGPTNISTYHWLAYAWMAQVSHLSLAHDFEVLGRATPIIFAMSLAGCLVTILGHILGRDRRMPSARKWTAFLSFFVFATIRVDFASPSGVLGLAVLLVAALVIVGREQSASRMRNLLCFLPCLITLTLSKVFYLPTLGVIALVSSVVHLRYRRVSFFLSMIVLSSACLLALKVIGPLLNDGSTPAWQIEIFDRRPRDILRHILVYAYTIALSLIAALHLMRQSDRGRSRSEDSYRTVRLTTAGATCAILALASRVFIVPGYSINIEETFYYPALLIALLPISQVVVEVQDRTLLAGVSLIAFVSASLTFDVVREAADRYLAVDQLVASSSRIWWLDVVTSTSWFVPVVVLAMLVFTLTVWQKEFVRGTVLSSLILGGSLLSLLDVSGHRLVDAQTTAIREARNSLAVSVIGQPDLVTAGEWLRTNTPSGSRFATNALCDKFQDPPIPASSNGTPISFSYPTWHSDSCVLPGTDYTLARVSNRQFLVLGPRFAYENPRLRDKSVAISLSFANLPTEAKRLELRRYDMDFFVMLRTGSASTASSKFPSALLFATNSVEIWDLRKPLVSRH